MELSRAVLRSFASDPITQAVVGGASSPVAPSTAVSASIDGNERLVEPQVTVSAVAFQVWRSSSIITLAGGSRKRVRCYMAVADVSGTLAPPK